MNKCTTLFMILSLIVHTPIFANNYYLGTYSPYDTMNIYYPPIPEDLHIRFIEHLGRHGSRYPTSGKEINFLVQILETQHNDQNLSFQGETLLKQLQLLYHQCENKWGECTALAIDQQRGIAERLMKEVGMEVFQNIVVICDPKQRCTSSYQYFITALNVEQLPHSEHYKLLSENNNLLNFFETNKAYLNYKNYGPWIAIFEKYKEHRIISTQAAEDLFENPLVLDKSQLKEITKKLFSVMGYAANIPNNNIESSYFDSLTLKKLWEITNTKQYLEKGPTSLKGNMSTLISTPLVNNFIASVEANLVADTTKSTLRFAHAETIIPFAACIGIPQADKSTQKADSVAKLWNDYKVSPMAANIIWIICTDNKNNCYISIRLNEQPVKMPLKSKYPYFYAWNEFKTHIINRMLLLDSDS